MANTRMGRAKKNIAASLGCQIITILCGLIVPRVMLAAFGSELYGATTSITQFLSYIALLEGGVGGVARAVLYKPLANNDHAAIGRIMGEIRAFFRGVGYLFAGYVIIIAFGFKQISGLNSLDWITSAILVGVISLSTFGQYFIGISHSVFLQAAQRSYVTYTVNILTTLINAVLVCVLVRLDCDIVTVKLVSSIVFFLRPVALWLYVHYKFKLKITPKGETKHLTQKWSGLGQHIAYYLHSNTDVVILTFLSDLFSVAVYSVYYMVISNIQNLVASFASGMEALFGDMLAKQEYDNLHKTFGKYETVLSVVSVILLGTTLSVILPFVALYTADVTDANYHVPTLAAFLTLASLLYCLRMPYHSIVIAAGHFRQTQLAAYGEAILNVALSIVLVFKYGIPGVAFATMLATALRFGYYVVYLWKNIIYRKPVLFLRRFLANAAAFGLSIIVGKLLSGLMQIHNYLDWALCACVITVAIATITLTINFVFFPMDMRDMAKRYTKNANK